MLGKTNAEIADLLSLSEATVKTHINRLFAKLSLRDRSHAVILAYEIGSSNQAEHRPSQALQLIGNAMSGRDAAC